MAKAYVTVMQGLFIVDGIAKFAEESFEIDTDKVVLPVLRDVIEGVQLGNLGGIEDTVLEDMVKSYLKRKGESTEGVYNSSEGLIRLNKA